MKQIEIVKVQIVRDKLMYYSGSKHIRIPQDAVEIAREYIGNEDREHFIVMLLPTVFAKLVLSHF
ncbi:MAG: hypothetical protein OWR52_13865 [Acidibacillus sp.]|nr:hypothetical protein [Acidibacillus sp.]